MKNIPTAEEFLKSKGLFNDKSMRLQNIGLTSSEAMIEFARFHVEAALKAAAEDVWWDVNDDADLHNVNITINKDLILNAYPLTNIK